MGLLEETQSRIEPQDADWRKRARERLEQLTMPHWALGRLMDMSEDLAGMTRSMSPSTSRKVVVVMAGDHGVVGEGVSPYPQEVTGQMVRNFVAGGAGINAVASVSGTRVVVVDMGVNSDLSDLVSSGDVIGRRIASGTYNYGKGSGDVARGRSPFGGSRHRRRRGARRLGRSIRIGGYGDWEHDTERSDCQCDHRGAC